MFSETENASHTFAIFDIIFLFFSSGFLDLEKCGKRPSFFADVYLHIVFIQCILDGYYEEADCQRQQDYNDRKLQCNHDDFKDDNKDFGIVVSIGSRLYFSSWMLFSFVICDIISILH